MSVEGGTGSGVRLGELVLNEDTHDFEPDGRKGRFFSGCPDFDLEELSGQAPTAVFYFSGFIIQHTGKGLLHEATVTSLLTIESDHGQKSPELSL